MSGAFDWGYYFVGLSEPVDPQKWLQRDETAPILLVSCCKRQIEVISFCELWHKSRIGPCNSEHDTI